jgi:hypothetical protein
MKIVDRPVCQDRALRENLCASAFTAGQRAGHRVAAPSEYSTMDCLGLLPKATPTWVGPSSVPDKSCWLRRSTQHQPIS